MCGGCDVCGCGGVCVVVVVVEWCVMWVVMTCDVVGSVCYASGTGDCRTFAKKILLLEC